MECGSEASAHAEASASALQTCPRAAPLSHIVGEGLGVRAESGRTMPTANPSDVPLSARGSPLPHRGRGAGGEGKKAVRAPHTVNSSDVPLSAPAGSPCKQGEPNPCLARRGIQSKIPPNSPKFPADAVNRSDPDWFKGLDGENAVP